MAFRTTRSMTSHEIELRDDLVDRASCHAVDSIEAAGILLGAALAALSHDLERADAVAALSLALDRAARGIRH